MLGVSDDGTLTGVQKDAIDRMKRDFVTTINNGQKFYPPLYLQPETIMINDHLLLVIQVPNSTQVCRYQGRIYDRNYESDIDITDNSDLVYQLYARKKGDYFVDKVTRFQVEDLRPDLIERARKMASFLKKDHPWQAMNDIELLRSTGLLSKDERTQKEGITLAGVLLFGKDNTIVVALPQHRTDAIFRVKNVDRYDDREVIITNLLESYDRLMQFSEKHLSDPFYLEGIQRISVRDKIVREVVSNSLAHRDYSSGIYAQFVIERTRLYTRNGNNAHGSGPLRLSTFQPVAKNPTIAKVFREIGFADELGSSMRNTYKYSKIYTGGEPEFIEGDTFMTVIPLDAVTVGIVGPGVQENDTLQPNPQANPQPNPQVRILFFCQTERTKTEIVKYCGYKDAVVLHKEISSSFARKWTTFNDNTG